MRSLLRVTAVLSALGLLIGCVWFAQKQAAPTPMPGSKSGMLRLPADTVSLEASKSEPPVIMSGSKSFSGPVFKTETVKVAPKP